jgi:ABC-type Zn uptake system ZnuABC Zn-binding protein ZnuA
MSVTTETRVKELEGAIKHLQKIQQEQHENLSSEFSNRIESQFNLLKYLFTKYETMKEVAKSIAREAKISQSRLDELCQEAKERAANISIQDEMLEEYKDVLEKDNG